MRFPVSISRPMIGIDIGTRLIKAAQLGRRRDEAVLTASAIIGRSHPDAPFDHDEVRRLARVLSQQGFAGRSVVLSAASERVMSSVIDMPPRESGAPYDVITTQEFARLQRLEPGRFEVAWWDVPKPARASGAKVMAVGCAHVDCEHVLNVFEECGFDVVAMDYGLCASVRACRGLFGPSDGVSAVLDMGWNAARLAVVHAEVIVFDRVLNGSGLSSLLARVGKALSIDTAEADALVQNVGLLEPQTMREQPDARLHSVTPLLRPILTSYLNEVAGELNASFEYAAHQYPGARQHRLVIVGGGGGVPGVGGYLDGLIAPEVTIGRLTTPYNRKAAGEVDGGSALLTTAMGLAGYRQRG